MSVTLPPPLCLFAGNAGGLVSIAPVVCEKAAGLCLPDTFFRGPSPGEKIRALRNGDCLTEPDREAILFQALKENSDDEEALRVYADYLMFKDDPRGELIALHFGPSTNETEQRKAAIQREVVTALVEETGVLIDFYGFAKGLLRGVGLQSSTANGLKALLEARDGSFIRALGGNFPLEALVQVLPQSQVRGLDFRFKNIGDEGIRSLAQVLPQSQVMMLDLAWNKIGGEGARSLASVLPASQVTMLDLSENRIDDEGARALFEALPRSRVTSLDLRYNQLSESCLMELAKLPLIRTE